MNQLFAGAREAAGEEIIKIDEYEQTKRLIEFQDSLSQPCRFQAGDFVTPKIDAPYKGAGKPHLVLVAYPSTLIGVTGKGDPLTVYDMIIAEVAKGANGFTTMVYAVPSRFFEKYTGMTYSEVPDDDDDVDNV
jgi:hypothetical protein